MPDPDVVDTRIREQPMAHNEIADQIGDGTPGKLRSAVQTRRPHADSTGTRGRPKCHGSRRYNVYAPDSSAAFPVPLHFASGFGHPSTRSPAAVAGLLYLLYHRVERFGPIPLTPHALELSPRPLITSRQAPKPLAFGSTSSARRSAIRLPLIASHPAFPFPVRSNGHEPPARNISSPEQRVLEVHAETH